MKFSSDLRMLFLVVLLIVLITVPIYFSARSSSTTKAAVEEIVSNYLKSNPEVVIEAINNYQKKLEEDNIKTSQDNLKNNKDEILNDKTSAVAGNVNGKVVVVEFFDYQCGYCRRVLPDLTKFIENNKDVKLILKELPILGPESEIASRVAIAVHLAEPDHYFDFYKKLMTENLRGLGIDKLVDLAASIGVDKQKLQAQLKDNKSIDEVIAKNRELAMKIGIRGTPAFIFDDKLVPSAIDYNTMVELAKGKK